MGCVTTGWRYEQFEASFLAFVEQLDLPTIIRNDDSEKTALDDAIQSLQGHQLTLKTEMEKAYGLLNINPDLAFVADKLGSLQQHVKDLERQLEEKKDERESLEATENAFYESKDEIKSLIDRLRQQGEGDLYKLRSTNRCSHQKPNQCNTYCPFGRQTRHSKELDELGAEGKQTGYRNSLQAVLSKGPDRSFTVVFRNVDALIVYPDKDDPLKLKHRVVLDPALRTLLKANDVSTDKD